VSSERCSIEEQSIAFLVSSERCSIEEQSIEYCGWMCCVCDMVHGDLRSPCKIILKFRASEGARTA
jgi:hypothetical protein